MTQQIVLRQQIYKKIKQDIITCTILPGEPISEGQFVMQFQVSKTPIREALTSLVQDGLVEYTPNHGFRVTGISVKDIQEIFEARIIYESVWIRMIIPGISDAEINELEKIVQNTENMTEKAQSIDSVEANLNFHLALAALAHNSRLYRYYANLLNEAQRLFYMDFVNYRFTPVWGHGHEKIIAALRARNEEAAITAIEEILESARKRVLKL